MPDRLVSRPINTDERRAYPFQAGFSLVASSCTSASDIRLQPDGGFAVGFAVTPHGAGWYSRVV